MMQVRFYRFLALLFLFVGLMIFVVLYLNNIEGRLLEAFTEIHTISIILFPFVPAAILSWLAKSAEKKYLSLVASSNAAKH